MREDIVYRGNLAKFGQNEELRKALLETGDSVLVEASPLDKGRALFNEFYSAGLKTSQKWYIQHSKVFPICFDKKVGLSLVWMFRHAKFEYLSRNRLTLAD